MLADCAPGCVLHHLPPFAHTPCMHVSLSHSDLCLPLPPFISFPLLPLFLACIYLAANLVRDKSSWWRACQSIFPGVWCVSVTEFDRVRSGVMHMRMSKSLRCVQSRCVWLWGCHSYSLPERLREIIVWFSDDKPLFCMHSHIYLSQCIYL
jgi:hypothetical protein